MTLRTLAALRAGSCAGQRALLQHRKGDTAAPGRAEKLMRWIFEETSAKFCLTIESLSDGSGLYKIKIETQHTIFSNIVSLS